MIKIENVEVLGWEHAIMGMRNPMNSWDKSDSGNCVSTIFCPVCKERNNCKKDENNKYVYFIGENDLDLMKRLVKAGTDHRKFMRMIVVYADITAPLYWLKEMDTYKVGTVRNSCSTMHKIAEKEFTLDDFSHEHLINDDSQYMDNIEEFGDSLRGFLNSPLDDLKYNIDKLNAYRQLYLKTNNKIWWWQMIQSLPSSYNQRSTFMLNYEVLANMYHSRKIHKLDEWVDFCKWIETLPYSELITGNC